MGVRDSLHGERDPGGYRPRVYPPVWAALFAGGMWLLARWCEDADVLQQLAGSGALERGGIVVMVAAVAFSGWAAWGFSGAGTPIEPGRVSTALLTGGPYRFTRNPIYLGMAMSLVGWAMWLTQPLALAGVLGFVVVIRWRVISHEERMLRERFGEEYAAYCGRVRRWL